MHYQFFTPSVRVRTTRRADAEAAISLKKRRRWFDGEGDGNGGNDGGANKGGNADAGNTGTPPGKDGGNAGDGNDEARITLPKRDFDDRIARAKQAAVNELLQGLGVEDAETLKAALKRLAEIDEADKTELEKVRGELEKERAARKKAEDELAALRTERIQSQRESAVIKAAQEMGAKNPEDVIMYAKAHHADLLEQVLTEEGKTDDKTIGTLLRKVREARKDWFSTNPGSPSNGGGKSGVSDKEAWEIARRNTLRAWRG